MKIAARIPTVACALVAALALSDRTANAVSGCMQRNFGSTTVRECYDSADSYTTFSNACGTQRVDAQAASHGAVPTQIVPCPRSGSPASGGSNPSSGNPRSEDLRSGSERFQQASRYYGTGDFGMAGIVFAQAESYFRRGGDEANAANARRNKNLSICHDNIGNDSPAVLHLLLGEGEREVEMAGFDIPGEPAAASTQRLGACTAFPAETQRIRERIAAIDALKRQQAAEAAQRQRDAAEAAAHLRAIQQEQARRRAAEEAAAAQRRADEERERQRETEKREAAQQLAQATQEAVANGSAKAARAQDQFAANDPLNSGAQGFDAASKRAQGQRATVPTVESLRASQGNCSDITGLGTGGGPVNCTPSNGSNTQARLNQAQASLQAGQAVSQSDPNSAVGKLLEAARLFQAADQVEQAAAAFAEAIALEKQLSCPPVAPQAYWPDNGDYCAKASTNCVERGSALYGLVCYAGRAREAVQTNTDEASRKTCADARTILLPHAPDKAWLANQLAKVKPPCNANGTPMSLLDRLRWDVKQRVTTQGSP